MFFSRIVLGVIALNWAACPQSIKHRRTVLLERADLKFAAAALAFNAKGELYVAYRDKGSEKRSSSLWFRVFDPASGKELRAANLQTPEVRLPIGGNQLVLAPDSSLLVYSEFRGNTLMAVLDAATLQNVSETTTLPDGADRQFPQVISIGSNDRSVLIAAEKTNRLNGTDVRLIRLDAHELSRVLSDVTLTNPIPESGFAIGPNGEARIVRANMLYGYDPSTAEATLEVSIKNRDDIRNVLFLQDGSLIFWSNQNEFGYLYRWKKDGSALAQSRRIEGSGVTNVFLSPDQVYAVALCEHQDLREAHFGAITSRTALVFNTKTLQILTQISLGKHVHWELAVWHGNGKIILAAQTSSNRLVFYELAEPKSGGESAIVDPKDGSL
jgi:WD40 repeat protein